MCVGPMARRGRGTLPAGNSTGTGRRRRGRETGTPGSCCRRLRHRRTSSTTSTRAATAMTTPNSGRWVTSRAATPPRWGSAYRTFPTTCPGPTTQPSRMPLASPWVRKCGPSASFTTSTTRWVICCREPERVNVTMSPTRMRSAGTGSTNATPPVRSVGSMLPLSTTMPSQPSALGTTRTAAAASARPATATCTT